MSTITATDGNAFNTNFGIDDEQPLAPAEAKTVTIVAGVLLALIVAAYWDTLAYASTYWSRGLYSHGWIVPLIAGYLFWIRKKPLTQTPDLQRWAGVGLIAVCLAVRAFWSSKYDLNNPDRLSFIGCLLGLCLLAGGVRMLKWAGPTALFLAFMFPFPARFENTMLIRLQNVASIVSTWLLQLMGVAAVRRGNVLEIEGIDSLTVAEACSGLRMLTIFGAFTFALVLTIDRPWWDRLALVVLGWVPIALISNVVRIVVTALLFMAFGQKTEWLNAIIHDWAGFAMMPIGLGLLWLLMTVLTHLTLPAEDEGLSGFGGGAFA